MLKLQPDPTFKADVEIHVPGQAKPEKVKLIFNHKNSEELKAYMEGLKKVSDIDNLMEIVAGWDGVDTPFSREAIETMLKNYHTAGLSIYQTYTSELTKARLGN